jgi:uncharacterized iron-regulated membrane protein
MNGRQFTFGASGNPLLQALSFLVFGVLLIGAVIMGAVVLAVLLGVAVIAALVFSIRLWWLRRKLGGRGPFNGGPQQPGHDPGPAKGARLIEGEYEVISKDAQNDARRPR